MCPCMLYGGLEPHQLRCLSHCLPEPQPHALEPRTLLCRALPCCALQFEDTRPAVAREADSGVLERILALRAQREGRGVKSAREVRRRRESSAAAEFMVRVLACWAARGGMGWCAWWGRCMALLSMATGAGTRERSFVTRAGQVRTGNSSEPLFAHRTRTQSLSGSTLQPRTQTSPALLCLRS